MYLLEYMRPQALVRLLNEEHPQEEKTLMIHLHYTVVGYMYSSYSDCSDRPYNGYVGRLTDTRYDDGRESFTEWGAYAMSPSAYKRFQALVG